jgi:hypothetical protein
MMLFLLLICMELRILHSSRSFGVSGAKVIFRGVLKFSKDETSSVSLRRSPRAKSSWLVWSPLDRVVSCLCHWMQP